MRLEQRGEPVQPRRVRDSDAGLEAPVRRRLIAELQRGDAQQRKGVAVSHQGVGEQLRVVDDLQRGGQQSAPW